MAITAFADQTLLGLRPTPVPIVPLLADVGQVLSVLFVIIAFVSWLWNVINGNKGNAPPAAAGRAQPPPGGQRVEKDLQAEINRFLKNVMGQPADDDGDSREGIEDDELKPRPRPRPKRAAEAPPRLATLRTTDEEDSTNQGPHPGGRIAQRKGPGSSNLGSDVRQHLAEHMQDRLTKQAQEHLGHGVADKVQHDLGRFTGADQQRSGQAPTIAAAQLSATATGVAQMMKDPAGLKQAFVLNLILNRPTFGGTRRIR
jgi:hypothetical protein